MHFDFHLPTCVDRQLLRVDRQRACGLEFTEDGFCEHHDPLIIQHHSLTPSLRAIYNDRASDHLKAGWQGLEVAVAALLRRDGYYPLQEGGFTGDSGIDLVSAMPPSEVVAVQCKHYSSPVKPDTLKIFHFDTRDGWPSNDLHHWARISAPTSRVIVGTSGFTSSARQLARQLGMRLIDSESLTELWLKAGLRLDSLPMGWDRPEPSTSPAPPTGFF